METNASKFYKNKFVSVLWAGLRELYPIAYFYQLPLNAISSNNGRSQEEEGGPSFEREMHRTQPPAMCTLS